MSRGVSATTFHTFRVPYVCRAGRAQVLPLQSGPHRTSASLLPPQRLVQLSWRREVRSNRSRLAAAGERRRGRGGKARRGDGGVHDHADLGNVRSLSSIPATCPGDHRHVCPGPSHSCVGTCGRYLAKLKRIVEKEARAPHRLGATPHTSPSANAATTLADVAGAWADVGWVAQIWLGHGQMRLLGRCGLGPAQMWPHSMVRSIQLDHGVQCGIHMHGARVYLAPCISRTARSEAGVFRKRIFPGAGSPPATRHICPTNRRVPVVATPALRHLSHICTGTEHVSPCIRPQVSATVVDCVISVPAFFTDVERRAVMDAASIAELKVGSSPRLRLE